MKRATRATLVLPLALTVGLTGCSGGTPEAVQSAYDACHKDGGDFGPILSVDGSSLTVDVSGKHAKEMSEGGLGVSLLIASTVDCLATETGYPGKYADLEDGETWDGWEYAYSEGAGSEFRMTFSAR